MPTDIRLYNSVILISGILSIAPQLIHGATEGPPGGPGPVFPARDLLGLTDDRGCHLNSTSAAIERQTLQRDPESQTHAGCELERLSE